MRKGLNINLNINIKLNINININININNNINININISRNMTSKTLVLANPDQRFYALVLKPKHARKKKKC